MSKNKITSIILILCLLMSSFAFNVNAEGTYTAVSGQSAEYAYMFLQHLGVFPSDIYYDDVKDKTVTRAEFAQALSKAFGIGESEEKRFDDVDMRTEQGRRISALAECGIIFGTAENTFSPETAIECTHMIIATMRALGYDAAVFTQNDYLKIARDIELTKKVKLYGEAAVSDFTILLFNAIHLKRVAMLNDSKEYYTVDSDSALKNVFGLEYVKGQITANAYSSIVGEKTDSTGLVKIGGSLYRTAVEDLGSFLGYNVIAYYSEKTGVPVIEYFVLELNSEKTVIDAEDFERYESGKIVYHLPDSNRTSEILLTDDVAVIKNSVTVTTDYASAFEFDFGTITCVMENNKCGVVVIDAYENYVVESIDISNKIIYTNKKDPVSGKNITINIDSKDVYVDIAQIPYGKKVNENTIVPDDLLSIAVSEDKKVVRGFLCRETVSGTVESVESSENKTIVTIGGNEYRVDPWFYDQGNIKLGDTGSYYLDALGRIAAFSYNASSNMKIAYVYKKDTESKIDSTIRVKLFNTSREHLVLEFAKKVKLDGEPKTAEDALKALCTDAGGTLKKQIIGYKLNDEGKISAIDLCSSDKEERESENTLYSLLDKGSYYWYYQVRSFNRQYCVNDNTYYMRVPSASSDIDDEDLYGCQKFSAVTWYNQNTTRSILGLYKFDDSTPYADLLLVENTDGTKLTNQTEITVVSSIKKSRGPDDDFVTNIFGYRRGVEVNCFIEDSVYRDDVGVGDIIRFVTDVHGYVSDYEIVYDVDGGNGGNVSWDYSDNASHYSNNLSTPSASLRYTLGYVNNLYIAPYANSLRSLIEIGSTPGVTEDIYPIDTSTAATTRFIVYDKNRLENKVYMGHLDEIVPYSACHDINSTSRVFVHSRSGWIIAVIIYK